MSYVSLFHSYFHLSYLGKPFPLLFNSLAEPEKPDRQAKKHLVKLSTTPPSLGSSQCRYVRNDSS